MKVYILMEDIHDGNHIVGVYDSLEKAADKLDKCEQRYKSLGIINSDPFFVIHEMELQ